MASIPSRNRAGSRIGSIKMDSSQRAGRLRQISRHALQRLTVGGESPVRQDLQTFAPAIPRSGLVVKNRDRASVIRHMVKAEIIPRSSGTSGLTSMRLSARGRRPTKPVMTRSQKVEWL